MLLVIIMRRFTCGKSKNLVKYQKSQNIMTTHVGTIFSGSPACKCFCKY